MENQIINKKEVVVYLMECVIGDKHNKNGYYYSEIYLDFRQKEDFNFFRDEFSNIHFNDEQGLIIIIKNIRVPKRLRRDFYYALDTSFLKLDGVELNDNLELASIACSFDFRSIEKGMQILTYHASSEENTNILNLVSRNNTQVLSLSAPITSLNVIDVGQGNQNELLNDKEIILVYDIGATFPMEKNKLIKLKDQSLHRYAFQKNKPLLVLSHWDIDHVYQLTVMTDSELRGFSGIVCPSQLKSLTVTTLFSKIQALLKNNVFVTSNAPNRGGNRFMSFLTKAQNVKYYYGKHANRLNYSGISLLVEGQCRHAILTGDCNYSQVTDVLNNRRYTPVLHLVMVAPHHGAAFCSSLNNLGMFSYCGCTAVISVGASNKYGHPKQSTLNMLQRMFCKTVRTDHFGDVSLFL